MHPLLAKFGNQTWVWVAGTALLSTSCVLAGRAVMPWEKMFPDYITYWTAGRLVADGRSPYDVNLQTSVQHDLGWDRSSNGRGTLDFLPYYYPPWFAAACTLLVPLGYEAGKLAWFFLNLELLFLTGVVLSQTAPGIGRSIPLLAFPLFLFSLLALLLGQTTFLIMFCAVVAWRSLEGRWDRLAGAALACLTSKPQLASVLVLALAFWAIRQRRWGVIQGFAGTLGLLCLLSSAILPSWPIEMLSATRRTPPPTDDYPWIGNTWFLILKTLGLRGWSLWGLYLAVALPFLGAVLGSALDPRRPVRDVLALGLLAVFFVVPYARHYDFPVLLIPSFVLLGCRLSEKAGALLLVTLIVMPYLQFALLVRYSRLIMPGVDFYIECTYFWVPVLLAVLWFATDGHGRELATDGR